MRSKFSDHNFRHNHLLKYKILSISTTYLTTGFLIIRLEWPPHPIDLYVCIIFTSCLYSIPTGYAKYQSAIFIFLILRYCNWKSTLCFRKFCVFHQSFLNLQWQQKGNALLRYSVLFQGINKVIGSEKATKSCIKFFWLHYHDGNFAKVKCDII